MATINNRILVTRWILANALALPLFVICSSCIPREPLKIDKKAGARKNIPQQFEDSPLSETIVDDRKGLTVALGDPKLTQGIPGDGTLTEEQIKKWIEDPINHRTLTIRLPLGLAAAEDNITGVDSNPMTFAKIELGRQLYFDPRLSRDHSVSCASCHDPDHGYANDTRFGIGVAGQVGVRNAPPAYNRILSQRQFWDGRAASLEAQAISPIVNPREMANTEEGCVNTLNQIEGYHLQFEKIFSEKVTIENVGKALATFQRALVTAPTAYDYLEVIRGIESQWEDELEELEEEDPELFEQYSAAKRIVESIDTSVIRGRDLFFSASVNCAACHAGANFADERYHNLGVGMNGDAADLGRFTITKVPLDRGAFKTPTLRNVALTDPYMHDGSQATLEEVVEWYAKGGHPNPFLSDKIRKLDLTEQDKADLVAFMRDGLTSDLPVVERARLPR